MNAADAILERMRADPDPGWVDRLLADIHAAPLVTAQDVQMEQRAPDDLSDVQIQTLRFHSHGLSDELTAHALGISVFTVKDHLKAVRYRLRAKNTTHACCLAIRLGLIA